MSTQKKPKAHPTVRTVIKAAPVDRMMVPLVNWLNSFDSVTTLFCCQGQPTRYDGRIGITDTEGEEPYCMFTCTQALDLTMILAEFGPSVHVNVSWSEEVPMLRYVASFSNRDHLGAFLNGLKRWNKRYRGLFGTR